MMFFEVTEAGRDRKILVWFGNGGITRIIPASGGIGCYIYGDHEGALPLTDSYESIRKALVRKGILDINHS